MQKYNNLTQEKKRKLIRSSKDGATLLEIYKANCSLLTLRLQAGLHPASHLLNNKTTGQKIINKYKQGKLMLGDKLMQQYRNKLCGLASQNTMQIVVQ